MSDIPQIVRDRLRAGAVGDPHPDADVLTAFAEYSLAPGERESIVRHLARCGDCREVVALSLPPMEETATAAEKVTALAGFSVRAETRPRSWFAWPNLSWAALAAGVVVVASVVLLRPGKPAVDKGPTLTAMNQPGAAPPPVEIVTGKSDDVLSKSVLNEKVQLSTNRKKELDTSMPSALRVPESAKASTGVSGGARLQGGAAGSVLADEKQKQSDLAVYGKNVETRQEAPAAQSVPGRVSESVEVSAASPAVSVDQAELAQAPPAADKLAARADEPAPVVKAKAPAKEEKTQTAEAASKADTDLARSYSVVGGMVASRSMLAKDAIAQWSFSHGVLRRSFDGGASWQIALKLDHPLLSFGRWGADVWAGSQAGELFHSVDNGVTWAQVKPSAKLASLSGDVIAIEIRSAPEVHLSTSNKESWTTTDGGKTWEKN